MWIRNDKARTHRWNCGNAVLFAVAVLVATDGLWAVEEDLAREAHLVAENWVARNAVPEQTLPIGVTRLGAVHATLRLEGWTAAQATAPVVELPGDATQPIDVMPFVASAIRDALDEAAVSLSRRGVLLNGRNKLVLDLQFAGPLEPIRLNTLGELPGKVTLNAHGLVMESGGRMAWSFPGNAVAANANLNSQLTRLLAELGLGADSKPGVGTADGPALFRFEVVHITRPVTGGGAATLYRGQELLPTEPLSDQELVLLGEQLADYLTQRQREDGSFAGVYHPTSDEYHPETTGASASALTVYALARASKLGGAEAGSRRHAAAMGLESLVKLLNVEDVSGRQVIGRDAEPTALTLLAMLETPGGGEFKEVRDRLIGALKAMQGEDGTLRSSIAANAPPASPAAQSAAGAAFVAGYAHLREPDLAKRAGLAIRSAAEKTLDEDRYRLLPWGAVARSEMSRLDIPVEGDFSIPDTQVKPWGDDEERPSPDAVGGYLLGTRLFAEPTFESAWALTAAALALREDRGVSEKPLTERLVNAGLGARFLSQLTLQPGGAYYTRNPAEALGGVRVALYDNRQPLEATAAALLAVTELRHTLVILAKK